MAARASEKFIRDTNQAVVPGHRVVQAAEVARVGVPHAHPGASPSVELVRDGDIIKAIDVTCSCGETMRIWCSYAAD